MKKSNVGIITNNNDKHTAQIGLRVFRFGITLYIREYWKYKSWFIFPGVSVDSVNGFDAYLDIELKVMFLGFGIRLIWIKKKNKK